MKSLSNELFKQNEFNVNEMKNTLGDETIESYRGPMSDHGCAIEYLDLDTGKKSIVKC